MEAKAVQAFQFSAMMHSTKPERTVPNDSLRMFGGFKKQLFVSSTFNSPRPSTRLQRRTRSLVDACPMAFDPKRGLRPRNAKFHFRWKPLLVRCERRGRLQGFHGDSAAEQGAAFTGSRSRKKTEEKEEKRAGQSIELEFQLLEPGGRVRDNGSTVSRR
ncbi:hypothetical protein V8G54_006564 [Vigna mungo]|uniref:Uncharacterized protein n=1 Tax=Vigna mungo TaxID=3915 RepID=A0AAQ3P258_VIGMU